MYAHRHTISLALTAPLAWVACGGDIGDAVPGVVDAGSSTTDGGVQTPVGCEPPDLMLILDRTGSMVQRPDGSLPPNSAAGAEQTKWYTAVTTIEALAEDLDSHVRFGLTLFPQDPDGAGGYDCSNLDTWLREWLPPESNDPSCQPAELMVSPAVGTSPDIASAIEVDGTGLCSTTPIGGGLAVARDELTRVADGRREQHALLITDGDDNCDGRDGYATDSLALADQLAANVVQLHVVGFDGSGEGIDEAHLNDLACAGGTAPSFAQNCELAGGGYRAVADPSPSRLFLLADDSQSLDDTLRAIGSEICCGCVD